LSSEKKLVAEAELSITAVTIRKLNLDIVVASSERIDPVGALTVSKTLHFYLSYRIPCL